ncbi:MAG: hypothetical protein NTX65_09990 [Ignavibacteriales bacterium]|nr:hypothetical protein [Ignavibacteriales bacterium]
MRSFLVLSVIVLFALQTTSSAQIEKIKLAGRHTIFVESGFKTNSTTSASTNLSGVEVKTGFIGSINYGYWFDEEWALSFGAGVFGAGASTRFNGVDTKAVMPILFGMRYYPAALALGSVGRVYAGLALGQYVGSGTRVKTLFTTETFSESVFGGEASFGIDLFVTSWFKFGPKLSYHFLGDFNELVGIKKNLSGAGFSVELGFVL